MFDNNTHPYDVDIPLFVETGTADDVCPPRQVTFTWLLAPAKQKVLVNVFDADHWESVDGHPHTLQAYSVRFLLCHLKGAEEACQAVYGTDPESLCQAKLNLADCRVSL